jgi:biotin operon repressor
MSLTRPLGAGQDCRHSREPFDTAFRVINERRDISPAAKLVHARLVTLLRTGRGETQAEIGAALGMSRHQVWRATGELVAVGLVVVRRRGLGLPNGYELVGIPDEDLRGRASRAPGAGHQEAGPAGNPARARHSGVKRTTGRTPGPLKTGQCMGCKGPHATPQCPRYGYLYST